MRKAIRLFINPADHDVFKDIIADRVTHTDVDRVDDDALDAWSMWNVGSSPHLRYLQNGTGNRPTRGVWTNSAGFVAWKNYVSLTLL